VIFGISTSLTERTCYQLPEPSPPPESPPGSDISAAAANVAMELTEKQDDAGELNGAF
jgi:hypothetical protein